MPVMPTNLAARRYILRFFTTMGIYVVLLFFVEWYIPRFHPSAPFIYLLALVPALPIIASLIVVGLYLAEEQDEFQRNVLIQSMLWSIGLTLALTTVWGFLEIFAHVPHFQSFLAFPLFWLFVGIATPALKRRYR